MLRTNVKVGKLGSWGVGKFGSLGSLAVNSTDFFRLFPGNPPGSLIPLSMYVYSFEKLDAWKEARMLVIQIYKSTKKFPADERFGLINQIRRAAISIASNLAEGSGRRTCKDQSRFYYIAYSSTLELLNQWIIAKDLEFINEEEFLTIRTQIEKVTIRIHRLKTVILSNFQTKPPNFQTKPPNFQTPNFQTPNSKL